MKKLLLLLLAMLLTLVSCSDDDENEEIKVKVCKCDEVVTELDYLVDKTIMRKDDILSFNIKAPNFFTTKNWSKLILQFNEIYF